MPVLFRSTPLTSFPTPMVVPNADRRRFVSGSAPDTGNASQCGRASPAAIPFQRPSVSCLMRPFTCSNWRLVRSFRRRSMTITASVCGWRTSRSSSIFNTFRWPTPRRSANAALLSRTKPVWCSVRRARKTTIPDTHPIAMPAQESTPPSGMHTTLSSMARPPDRPNRRTRNRDTATHDPTCSP